MSTTTNSESSRPDAGPPVAAHPVGVITSTEWGWFDKDGRAVALGHKPWTCPRRRYVPVGFEHPITGEWVDEGLQLEPACTTVSIEAKVEVCKTCGMEFRYP